MTGDVVAGVVLAHSPLLAAVPFFVPALLVVLAVGAVMWRDRHAPEDDEPGAPDGAAGAGPADGGRSAGGWTPTDR